jgi:hypothetical protein
MSTMVYRTCCRSIDRKIVCAHLLCAYHPMDGERSHGLHAVHCACKSERSNVCMNASSIPPISINATWCNSTVAAGPKPQRCRRCPGPCWSISAWNTMSCSVSCYKQATVDCFKTNVLVAHDECNDLQHGDIGVQAPSTSQRCNGDECRSLHVLR